MTIGRGRTRRARHAGVILAASLFVHVAHAAAACAPPPAFSGVPPCTWACPDYRKGGAPQNTGTLKHVARCEPQVGQIASYFEGTLTLAGRIERADTVTWGDVLVFYPDAISARLLPDTRRGSELWFVNPKLANKSLAAPRLDHNNPCWSAPARIVISGLLSDLGDHDGSHDWVSLTKVIEIGKYKNYGCRMS